MHYIRQQIFRRPHVCSTWDCSKLRLGHIETPHFAGGSSLPCDSILHLKQCQSRHKEDEQLDGTKTTSISIGDYTGLLLVFSGIAGCSGLLMIHYET